jgi:hypothetical protein
VWIRAYVEEAPWAVADFERWLANENAERT